MPVISSFRNTRTKKPIFALSSKANIRKITAGIRVCTPSMLIFHPSNEAHSDQFYVAARCFNIQMNARWQERARQYSLSLNHPADFRGGLLLQLAMRLYNEFHKGDASSPLIVEGIALEMMGEACRPAAGKSASLPPGWLVAARDLLHEQFSESLTLSEIAYLVGVHPVHLAREFRRFYADDWRIRPPVEDRLCLSENYRLGYAFERNCSGSGLLRSKPFHQNIQSATQAKRHKNTEPFFHLAKQIQGRFIRARRNKAGVLDSLS